MNQGMYASYGRGKPVDPRYSQYLSAARRKNHGMKPLSKPAFTQPKAPGLSSRISPGTVPMKKGRR